MVIVVYIISCIFVVGRISHLCMSIMGKREHRIFNLRISPSLKVAQNSNISVRSLGSNAPFSAGIHAITRGFVR